MVSFSLEIPTRIHFGRNTFGTALETEKSCLGDRVLVVTTGGSIERLGYLEELKEKLGSIVENVAVCDKVGSNPELKDVGNCIKIGREFGASSVIGFGGGSSIDAAKAVACGLACREPIGTYYYSGLEPEAAIPMIAIPTTAGTGSELSKAAILSDERTGQKKGLRGVRVYPKAAIVDSHFTEKAPHKVTMETGFDVFAHAVESLVSVKATPFSEMLSLDAIRLVGRNLVRLAEELDNPNAREEMSYASMIMGINLGTVGTALPHRLQYPIGVETGTSHAAGLLALYPAWLEYEYKYSSEKLDTVASILSGNECCGEYTSLNEIMGFIECLGVRDNLRGLGLASVQGLADMVSGNVKNDPAFNEDGVVENIYRKAFEG